MKKGIIALVIVLVVTAGIVGIVTRDGSNGTQVNVDAGDKTVQYPAVDTEPAVESVSPVNTGAGDTGEVVEDFSNLSRGYIDVDQSGDWSEGDIPLESDGDGGFFLPLQ